MEITQSSKPKNTVSLSYVSMVGALRGAIGLPFEHPFDTLKTWMQSEKQSWRQSVTVIYKNKGIKGFYSGFLVNLLRAVIKQAYRWPLNIYLISYFRDQFKHYKDPNSMAGVAAGISTAVIESVVICPFQRIKVWLMTSRDYKRYANYWQLKAWSSLFDGFIPVLGRQCLSWVSFLGSQEYLKQMVYRYKDKKRSQYQLTMTDLTLVSIMVCFVNTAFVMPIDYIKTHFQKYSENAKVNIKFYSFALSSFKEGGIKGFYRGSGVKIIQYNLNSLLTVPLFQKILRQYDQ